MLTEEDIMKYIADPAKIDSRDGLYFLNAMSHGDELRPILDIDLTRMFSGSVFLAIESDTTESYPEYTTAFTIYLKHKRTGDIFAVDIAADKDIEGSPTVTMKQCRLTEGGKAK